MFAGLIDNTEKPVELMVAHPEITGSRFSSLITRRFPLSVVRAGIPEGSAPSSLPVADAVQLASCRRGIEPIRIIVPPQRTLVPHVKVVVSDMDNPMPIIF